jgi:glucose/arabinose dehydrogenase
MRRAGLIALAAGALLAACGSGGDDTRAAAPTATATATAATTGEQPSATAAPQAKASRGVRLQSIGRFRSPVYVTAPPGDRRRLFVVEQAGRIMVLVGGRKRSTPFLDIRGQVTSGGEQGLLSVAFAPDYASSGRFYVYFTDRAGDQRVVEYQRASATRADAGSARLVLRMNDSEGNHNGGLLLFGPDRHLYIGTGDGGGAGDEHGARGNAQNLGALLGKILRIDPAQAGRAPYTIPGDNPFRGRSGARGEVYSYGLRNPWRFSFDRRTGDLAIGDVGQDAVEEIDFVRRGKGRGANFGWRPFEGRSRYRSGESAPGHVLPVIARTHGAGWCSITGGVVVRDRSLAGLRGRYLFGDICKPRIYSAKLSAGRATSVRRTSLRVSSVSSFGEDARGRVYAVSLNGPVYRLVPR